MSNQNAGYTVQSPAVDFAANLGSLTSNMRFYQQRNELSRDVLLSLLFASQQLAVAIELLREQSEDN